jgi:dihydrofolate reductase
MTADSTAGGRRVVGNISLSIDGRVTGPGGDLDMGWVARHAMTDAAREHMVRQTDTATTVLLGRKNYEGFGGYWPAVATDESADPRDRTLARWLDSVEKVVFSTTLTSVDWTNSRLADAEPADVVRELRKADGGDIIVQNSVSLIRQLLAADEIDRLTLTFCPEIVGGGTRLFEDGLPATSWTLTDLATADTGAMCLYYDRLRGDG